MNLVANKDNRIKGLVVGAFPGCGKTYVFRNQDKYDWSFSDSDSSQFKKYPGWEKEYVDAIEERIKTCDFVFIAQQSIVLQELRLRNIPFVTVLPNNTDEIDAKQRQLIKQQWFGGFMLRDNSHIRDFNAWLKILIANYDEWTSIEHIMNEQKPNKYYLLNQDQYISDILEELDKFRINIYEQRI